MKEFIKKMGLTWEDFASILGVPVNTVHVWCGGGKVSSKDERRICKAFGITREVLYDYIR